MLAGGEQGGQDFDVKRVSRGRDESLEGKDTISSRGHQLVSEYFILHAATYARIGVHYSIQ